MTNHIAHKGHKRKRQGAPWAREALLEWSLGLLLGLATATILVALTSLAFPKIEDYGVDVGMRIAQWWNEFTLVGIEPKMVRSTNSKESSTEPSYIFLDLDPEITHRKSALKLGDASVSACASLANAPKESKSQLRNAAGYQVVSNEECVNQRKLPSTGSLPNQEVSLYCAPTRPLNRYLIAELIHVLRKRNAKLVVVDVILNRDRFSIQLANDTSSCHMVAEQRHLATELADSETGQPRVIYALDTMSPNPHQITLSYDPLLEKALRLEDGGVVMTTRDLVVRRYPKVFRLHDTRAGHSVSQPSLPCLAANTFSVTSPSWCVTVEGEENQMLQPEWQPAPRISYTLPSLVVQDEEEASRRAFLYHRIYTRCSVEAFLSLSGPCSNADDFTNKVVVLGASNRFRGDYHFTPFGEMPGAEVIINATRSFLHLSQLPRKAQTEKSVPAKWLVKIQITIIVSILWLIYYSWVGRRAVRFAANVDPGYRAKFVDVLIRTMMFFFTILLAILFSLYLSFRFGGGMPNVDVILPVLAIGVDIYVEKISDWLNNIKTKLRRLLRLTSYDLKNEELEK